MAHLYDYGDGTTVTLAANTTVTGSGTLFLTAVALGDHFYGPGDAKPYEIVAITDDTHLTLDRAWAGTTGAGQAYFILRDSPLRSNARTASVQLSTMLTTYQSIINVTGNDRYLNLDKTAAGDNAGLWIKQGGTSLFRVGAFGDNDLHFQWLNSSTWTDAFKITAAGALSFAGNLYFASGKLGVGVAAPNELMEIAAATGARLLLSDGGGAARKGIVLQSPGSVAGYASIFAYDYGAAAGVNLVLQINGGNFGLGTTSPQKQFVVSKSGIGFEIAPDDPSSPGAVRTLAYDRGSSAYVQYILESAGVGLDVASVDTNYGLQLPNSSSKKAKANAWDTYSDGRIKPIERRAPIADPLAIVMAMNPMMFDQYDSDGLTLRSTYKRTIGFIAQDEVHHAPWLVNQGSTPGELWSLDYGRTSVLAIAGLKVLVPRVTALEEAVQLLTERILAIEVLQ